MEADAGDDADVLREWDSQVLGWLLRIGRQELGASRGVVTCERTMGAQRNALALAGVLLGVAGSAEQSDRFLFFSM